MNYRTPTIEEFLTRIASETVTPAGGTAVAVVGAIGTSLLEMVCVHTLENEDAGAVTADIADVRAGLHDQRAHLLDLAAADADVVEELFASPTGATASTEIKRSIGVPLTIATACANVLELARTVAAKGNPNAIADARTGLSLVHAAHGAAVRIARSNLDHVADRSFEDEIERRIARTESRAGEAHETVLDTIETRS